MFAYPLQWSVLAASNVIQDVMSTWVSKKIVEFLGEEEPSLVEFIIGEYCVCMCLYIKLGTTRICATSSVVSLLKLLPSYYTPDPPYSIILLV